MKYIIFGENGYIGKHLKKRIESDSRNVIINPKNDGSRIDILDLAQLSQVDWNVDFVMCFAGVTGTANSYSDPQRFLLGNEMAMLNILDSISRSNFRPRVVFPSSRLVFSGNQSSGLTEVSKKETKTVYAVNKLACEYALMAYRAAYSIPYTIYRICVPYGNSLDGEYSYGTIGSFIKQAQKSNKIRLYGDGSGGRTFTHVEDICNLIVSTSRLSTTENEDYNIPGSNLSLLEAAKYISERLNSDIELVPWPKFDESIESGSTIFDGNKIQRLKNTDLIHNFANWAKSIPVPN